MTHEHLKGSKATSKVGDGLVVQEGLQDQHGVYFFDPLVESDDLPWKLIDDLEGYEEPVGTNFGNWKHWEGLF
eukprot:scaffold174504_cov63-Attheya_sp.AAC.2